MTLFKDVNGNISSKRVAGFSALFISLVLTGMALFIDNGDIAQGMLYAWLGFASACLVGGVFERKQL